MTTRTTPTRRRQRRHATDAETMEKMPPSHAHAAPLDRCPGLPGIRMNGAHVFRVDDDGETRCTRCDVTLPAGLCLACGATMYVSTVHHDLRDVISGDARCAGRLMRADDQPKFPFNGTAHVLRADDPLMATVKPRGKRTTPDAETRPGGLVCVTCRRHVIGGAGHADDCTSKLNDDVLAEAAEHYVAVLNDDDTPLADDNDARRSTLARDEQRRLVAWRLAGGHRPVTPNYDYLAALYVAGGLVSAMPTSRRARAAAEAARAAERAAAIERGETPPEGAPRARRTSLSDDDVCKGSDTPAQGDITTSRAGTSTRVARCHVCTRSIPLREDGTLRRHKPGKGPRTPKTPSGKTTDEIVAESDREQAIAAVKTTKTKATKPSKTSKPNRAERQAKLATPKAKTTTKPARVTPPRKTNGRSALSAKATVHALVKGAPACGATIANVTKTSDAVTCKTCAARIA